MTAYKNIVILTGAGISAESGIQTFRASDGLWENHAIEEVATPEGYYANPSLVQSFYNQRRKHLQNPKVQPNKAHYALVDLEREMIHRFTDAKIMIVTQNIDNLHERAGSQNVFHMHGELLKARCPVSNKTMDCNHDLSTDSVCNCCSPPNPLRPHIVWFGEMPLYMNEIYSALEAADLFIAIGTSGVVYPAAGFVNEAKRYGLHTVEINLEPSAVNSCFSEKRYGLASEEVPKWVDELLQNAI